METREEEVPQEEPQPEAPSEAPSEESTSGEDEPVTTAPSEG